MRGTPWWLAIVLVLVIGVACVGTGVRDYKGWRAAIDDGEPCSELFDIKSKLPESVDMARVETDLVRIGCTSPSANRTNR